MRSFQAFVSVFTLVSLTAVHGFHFKPRDILRLRKIKLDGVLGNGVKQMEVDVKETVSSLLFGHKTNHHELDSTKPKLGSFSIHSCGPKDQPVKVNSLTIQPDPLYFPGEIKIGFDVEFAKTIYNTPDVDAKVVLDVHSGGKWINIPCLGSIGSCDYQDLCGQLSQIEACPPQFKAAGVPCKCPFQKGDYKLSNMVAEVDASVFLPGDYRGNITLTNQKGKTELGCYALTFTIG